MKYVNVLLTVPTTDPDDARRRRLLNIILMAALIASIIALIALILEKTFNPVVHPARDESFVEYFQVIP
jgi:hypothetical protein